ncbi:F-box/FBD/LRR-repeat protein At1g13570-like [Mercurialis annua]|uniref:F-box/FBD/LRR-repeat protein At1g13570-like n=1 Tax=Mercurialis annua TaxID=3986 RepID=UPI00215FC304|nr:F-box/FBD/LRR-repeat protein At1g13570-like [Mercurialis annua]
MDNPPAKKIGNSSRSDIISNLPSNIINNILSCLPIQEAVATSILSKEWRFKWRCLSKLYLLHETTRTNISLGYHKVLELPDICFRCASDISTTFSMIMSSPNLEMLEIGSIAHCEIHPLATEFLEVKDPLANELKKLRVVKVKLGYTTAIRPELEFIEILLARSVELEKMFIQPAEGTVCVELLEFVKKIIQFQRLSEKAKIELL